MAGHELKCLLFLESPGNAGVSMHAVSLGALELI